MFYVGTVTSVFSNLSAEGAGLAAVPHAAGCSRSTVTPDGLNFKKAIDIQRAIGGRIKTSFGIGTSLTCDIPGVEPMNIVIKMTSCNGQPVAKISDSQGKTMCEDEEFVSYLKHVFKVE